MSIGKMVINDWSKETMWGTLYIVITSKKKKKRTTLKHKRAKSRGKKAQTKCYDASQGHFANTGQYHAQARLIPGV